MSKESNNTKISQENIEENKANKIIFVTENKTKEEPSLKKLFKTNKDDYISTEVSPKKEVLIKLKNFSNNSFDISDGDSEIQIKTESYIENYKNNLKLLDKEKEEKKIKDKKSGKFRCNFLNKNKVEEIQIVNGYICNNIKSNEYKNIYVLRTQSKSVKNNVECHSKDEKAKENQKKLVLDCILIEDNKQIRDLWLENEGKVELLKKKRKKENKDKKENMERKPISLTEIKKTKKHIRKIAKKEMKNENESKNYKKEDREMREMTTKVEKEKEKKKKENSIIIDENFLKKADDENKIKIDINEAEIDKDNKQIKKKVIREDYDNIIIGKEEEKEEKEKAIDKKESD